MKKHLLILASLVLGFGQLFADEVTFDASVLWQKLGGTGSQAQTVTTPYEWKTSPYYVTVTFDDEGTQTVNTTYVKFAKDKSFTVAGATTGTTITKVTFTVSNASQCSNVGATSGTYSTSNTTGTWTPEEGTTPSSVTFTTTNQFQVKTIVVEYTAGEDPDPVVEPVVPSGDALVGPFEATPIESLTGYEGTDQYVFDMAARKYYALNNLGEYEEFGLYPEVSTLKVAGGSATEIEYIKAQDNAYINLNYIPKANTRAVAVIEAETGGDWKAIYGCGYNSGGWKDRFCFFTTNATIDLGGETGNRDAMRYGEKIVTVLDAALGTLEIYEADGTTSIGTITDSPKTDDCKTPLYVFAQNKDVPGGSTQTECYNMLTKLYSLKLYEGETLVMDLVPVVTAEGKGGLKDKLTNTVYTSANSGDFELSADGQVIAGEAGISVYPGKLVINTTDQHEYNWNGEQWVDLGSVYKPITDTNYQNMNNWTCRWSGYEETYGHIENDGNNNFFNPYNGKGDWEPYQCKVTGLTKGETYRVSFNFTSEGWNSWSTYTQLPFFVTDNWDFGRGLVPTGVAGEILGYLGLPQAAMTNQPYSFTFTADATEATLAIQFGVGDDNKNFYFHFDDLNIEFVDYPQTYSIDWVDPNKYTPLAYIEGTSQARANVFTTPYYAKANTEVDIKFQSYSGGNWRAIFSGRNGSSSNNGISLYQNGDQAHFGYFVGGYTNDNHADYPGHNQDITVAATLGNLNVNGTDYPTGQTTFASSTRMISIFANPEWDNAFNGRIYYITLKEDGETVYDFQPVMRHDGAFGYYDAATKTFLTPVQGNWDGYGYQKLTDEAYMTYNAETRIVLVGNTAQFLPDVQNLDGATYTWTSSDESKATVDANGTVTGKAAGKVTITVTTDADEGWTASYELTVSEPNYIRHDVNNVGYAVVTGGTGWGDAPVANLVDNDAATKFGCSGTGDSWAILIASEPVAVQQYSFVTGADTYDNPGRTPRSWKLEGSNDNQTWTVVDEQTQNYKAKTSSKEETVFTVNGTDAYKFFKFTATAFDGGFQLGEFWINEQAHTWGEAVETASTCTVPGKKEWTCSDCGALKTEALPLAAHTYANGVCTVCGGKVAEPVLLANGREIPYTVKFRHATSVSSDEYVDIEEGWANADFDDSDWDDMLLPLGTFGPYKTRWIAEYNTFWFRRPFYIDNPDAITKLTLKTAHDDDYAVFINGKKVVNATGWTANDNTWDTVEIAPADVNLVAGQNVLAVYIEQNYGGAYCDFSLQANVGANVQVGEAGYATFVAPVDVDFTGADVTPKAAKFDGNYVQLTDVTSVPAGTAVVVKADAGTYTVPATTDAVLGAENELVAATADVTADGTQYILAKEDEGVGFYKATTGSTINAGKGYLVIEGSAGVKGFYGFDEDATGINAVEIANENAPVYNVAGQRLQKMQKGINIVGGKKVLK